ncbi:hypothetical protein AB0K51_12055 [Kitasatospora sp. NPDC049285]|uniref:hypothetical protein n=1 Tax=Kitasatospora sp. NPDC049285 TaxID=3157096 RepID=UPI00341600BC
MAARGTTTHTPGGPAYAVLRPVAVLWSLLLAALLALLPCAASARTLSAPPSGPQTPVTAAARADALALPQAATASDGTRGVAVHHHAVAVDAVDEHGVPFTWCTADGQHPVPGNGCSSHPFCGPESQLPNAPPQPGAVTPPLLAPPALPAVPASAALAGPDHAPDLHVLQVHRS